MKSLRTIAFVAFLVGGMVLPAAAQGLDRASRYDAYCSGFIAVDRVPKQLRVVGAEDRPGVLMFTENDLVYLGQGSDAGIEVGNHYMIVRAVTDPDPNEIFAKQDLILAPGWSFSIGYQYMDIGHVEVVAVHPTIATARVTFVCDAVGEGDILMPFENRPMPTYRSTTVVDRFTPPSGLAQGLVLSAKDHSLMVSTGQAIYTDLGEEAGISTGDLLLVYRSGAGARYKGSKTEKMGIIRRARGQEKDSERPKPRKDLPREILAEAFVVRAEQRSSTAIITASLREVHPGDYVELQPLPPPELNLTVWPEAVEFGQSATLSWSSRFATRAELRPGPGTTEPMGTMNVRPGKTTTYTLVASGPGGTTETNVTLEVTLPPPPPEPPPPTPVIPDIPLPPEGEEDFPDALPTGPSVEEAFATQVRDVFFDFDRSDLTEQSVEALDATGQFLQQFGTARLLIEGHTDEVGSDNYNQALAQRRADAVRDYLLTLGVAEDRMDTASIGEARPFCSEENEACRQLNRRAHIVLQTPGAVPGEVEN